MNRKMCFHQNISIKRIIIFLIIMELIIVYLFLKNSRINEFVLKSLDQNSINVKVCGIILKNDISFGIW
jgi:hypothetical protein